jgi:light-regulated signal transduction histidine kinase (bacteriophytochrome)
VTTDSPAFGQADLTNCERELIHLAGSVQPHGVLLVLSEPELRIVQASANAAAMLDTPLPFLLNLRLVELGGSLESDLRALAAKPLAEPATLHATLAPGGSTRRFEVVAHRVATAPRTRLVVELEPMEGGGPAAVPSTPLPPSLPETATLVVQRLSSAPSLAAMADVLVHGVRDLTGYDRVMVYQFDPEGHGKIVAEARDPGLEPLLGHHYPVTDIPQRARDLYLRNRLRMLVDVHAEASPLVPRLDPDGGGELDMSLCQLRSMSPLHLQYLKNMGVTATLVVALVRAGRLWGLIACHHRQPRHLRLAVRAACALLAEVAATRIAAIEHYAHAQVAIQVRLLEQRLIEAASTEGDWRLALLHSPRNLLQPLDATGAALCCGTDLLPVGESPSTPELRMLLRWVDEQDRLRRSGADAALPFACSSVGRAEPALASLAPTACGVLAVRLSPDRPDYLMWFRKEQVSTVTWAGNPAKPTVDDDPLTLSPRRSFAAWTEVVRGTARPWTPGERSIAHAFGAALADVIVQVNAVQLLIVEHQRAQLRDAVAAAAVPVLVVDARCRLLFANDALERLVPQVPEAGADLGAVIDWFDDPVAARRLLSVLCEDGRPAGGHLLLCGPDGRRTPVGLHAEAIPGRDGGPLGYLIMFDDLSGATLAATARAQFERSIAPAADAAGRAGRDPLAEAIVSNARLAALDIADGAVAPSVASLLEELEASTRRAAAWCDRLRGLDAGRD